MKLGVAMKPAYLVSLALAGLSPGARGDAPDAEPVFRAGAAAVEISPPKLPVIINGGFLEKQAQVIRDPLHARSLVLDDGTTRLAITIVDSCMVPRELADRAKQIAHERTGIPIERMLIAATHTHSAPSAMGALGSRPDPDYVAFLPARIAEAIAQAAARLAPAEVGWAVVDDFEHTHCRRWIRRPDRLLADPFGDRTVRANMHPGHQNPDVIGPSGPVDPGLSVLALRRPDGRPLALLANYAMHYFGAPPVSADYFGRFATRIAQLLGAEGGDPPFVALMSQGTSGDQQWMDYGRPRDPITIDAYADAVAQRALDAYRSITYRPRASLAMAETRLKLRRRVPDERRLAWARPIVAAMGDRVPKDQVEVYAREALYLHEEPERELKLQAIRIGELGIAAIPNEVYALTGLKLKARSPLVPTFVIELANGSEGYIPPPEQHALGGYTTWPARTAGLEVQAEPKIVEAVLGLLEAVAGRPRRTPREPNGPYAAAVLASRPLAYWRLGEMSGPEAIDATGHDYSASFEGGIAYHLEGPPSPAFSGPRVLNRAVHLAGGCLTARLPDLGASYSIELWFWNGLPPDARAVTGVLLSRDLPRADGSPGDHLAIGGTRAAAGRLLFSCGDPDAPPLPGRTEIAPRTWHHVALVRDGDAVALYLDGSPEVSGRAALHPLPGRAPWLIGGQRDGAANFEGKLDEVALYDRALTAAEIADHYRASASPPEPPMPGARPDETPTRRATAP
ncbi:MAG: LamG domain-containing protein [Isosphaeraceae bacterium]|nr:LamG domain-containing protein [Isosphaeraceae bacterium]